MAIMKSSAVSTTTLLFTSMLPVAAVAQSTGLEDMVGARAGQAEGELQRRGFVNTGGSKGDDRSYTNWWNAARRQCVTIATMNGRYDSITSAPAPDCGRQASERPGITYPDRPAAPQRPGYARPPAYAFPDRRPTQPDGGDPVVDGRSVNLGLVCFGDGTRDGIASGTTWTWNRERDRYEYGRYNETRKETFDASLMVQTWDGGGRIPLPKSLIPPLNSRGNDGWWALSDLSIEPDTISATYRLNGLNKPRMVIDRRTGRITVQGFADYGFRGTCDVIGNEPRRF